MALSVMAMAWWGIVLTVLGAIIGSFLLVWGVISIYLIIKGERFNKKNKSCVEEENSVKPRESKNETIE